MLRFACLLLIVHLLAFPGGHDDAHNARAWATATSAEITTAAPRLPDPLPPSGAALPGHDPQVVVWPHLISFGAAILATRGHAKTAEHTRPPAQAPPSSV